MILGDSVSRDDDAVLGGRAGGAERDAGVAETASGGADGCGPWVSAGGGLPDVGELCREIGEVERGYIESFRTFRYDLGYRHDTAVSGSVERLAAWYEELDRDLWEVLEGLEEADLARRVDRGGGFTPAATVQFHIYREALLIFYAKADVYLKALGRRVAGDWQSWIGDRADYETAAE